LEGDFEFFHFEAEGFYLVAELFCVGFELRFGLLQVYAEFLNLCLQTGSRSPGFLPGDGSRSPGVLSELFPGFLPADGPRSPGFLLAGEPRFPEVLNELFQFLFGDGPRSPGSISFCLQTGLGLRNIFFREDAELFEVGFCSRLLEGIKLEQNFYLRFGLCGGEAGLLKPLDQMQGINREARHLTKIPKPLPSKRASVKYRETVHEAFVKLSSMSLFPRDKGLEGCGIGITPTPGPSPCGGEGSFTPSP
jgi:hypothetical protein